MKNTVRSIRSACLAVIVLIAAAPAVWAYTKVQEVTLGASATLGSGSSSSGGAVTLNIPQILPVQAFFGKNIVIPIQLQGPAGTISQIQTQGAASGVSSQMVYQEFNSAGAPLGSPTSVPIAFQATPNDPTSMLGTAIVPVQTLRTGGQNGSFSYYFQLQNGALQTLYKNNGVPYQVQFITTMSQSVSNTGSVVIVPDTAIPDGKTSFVFGPGVLANPGTVVVRQIDPLLLPRGPAGLLPIVAYDFELQGTSLLGNTQVALSYPSNSDGSIIGSNGNASNLSLFGLQGTNWLQLSPRQWNSNLHTITTNGSQFSTFALFLAAGNSAADLRPRRRVLTPNGDGINDSITFEPSITDNVKIFDLKGRRVKTLTPTNLTWDGTDDGGRIVESGLYIYQYMLQGERISGVILIAK